MRLQTRARLREIALYSDNSADLEFYREIISSVSHHRYTYFGNITFDAPVTDILALESVARRLRKSLIEFYYRRRTYRSELKFLFFIERHRLRHKHQDKYHIHFLVTNPTNPVLDINSEDYQIRHGSFPNVIQQKLKRIKIITPSRRTISASIHIEKIYDQENLADYCLKKLRQAKIEYVSIDYLNSDLNFNDAQTNVLSEEDRQHEQ